MASKSKRRRKVLGASCILAALIIAGSSFAWFTSKDEVSNRLSANADYGVSIVESFAPPKNWLPGQEVNKDVYATNTGNIGAFVREDVSGTLTVTKEIATTSKTANSIKLTQEERYAVEAGAFLAYKPVDSAAVVGDQVVVRPADKAGSPSATDFTPDKSGLYVFRRSLGVNADGTETFKYDGYYVDVKDSNDLTKNEYYKISNLNPVADATADKAGDGNKTDGNLAAASAGFWEEKTEVVKPVALEYNDNVSGKTGKYLVASYDTGNYIKEANFAAASDAYDQAIHNYQYLSALVTAATNEANTAAGNTGDGLGAKKTLLDTATTNLSNAVNALKTAADNLDNAIIAKSNADTAEAYAAQKVKEAKIALYGDDGSGNPKDASAPSTDSLLGKKNAAATALGSATASDNQRFEDEIDAWFDAQKTVPGTQAALLYDNGSGVTSVNSTDLSVAALEEFSTWVSGHEGHDFYTLTAANKIAVKKYEDKMTELYGHANGGESGETAGTETGKYTTSSLYGEWKTADADKTSTGNTLGAENDPSTGTSKWAAYNKAKEDLETAKTGYENAYNAWYDAYLKSQAATAKKDELDAAKGAANQAMATALVKMNAAETAMNAVDATDGILKIYIKLADNVNTTGTAQAWQMLPAAVANDTAVFYYKGILEGGETSAKLIDSVELDEGADQKMYKYFDFDLNVALKSAQITYADDNKTILATATPDELDAVATLGTATDIDTEITWAATH